MNYGFREPYFIRALFRVHPRLRLFLIVELGTFL